MRNKLIKRIFPVVALLLLTPWPIAYAHTYTGDTTGQGTIRIEVAEPSVQPTWTAFGKAIGGVSTPGTLFYIDATNNSPDIQTTLYITNAQELLHNYRYLTLKVGIYAKGGTGEWERISTVNGEPLPDIFITMHNGQVSFTLPGLAQYKVAIDSGSFYCTTTNTDTGSLSPQFYLEVN